MRARAVPSDVSERVQLNERISDIEKLLEKP